MKIFEKIKIKEEREIRLLGLPVLQYGKKEQNGVVEKFLDIFPISLRAKLIQEIKLTNIEFDDLYIIRQRTGETFIVSQIIKNIIELNGSKKPLVVGVNKFQEEIFRLVEKDINYIYIQSNYDAIGKLFPKTRNKVGKHQVYNFMRFNFYKDFYKQAKEECDANYIEYILKEFGLEKNIIYNFKNPLYKDEVCQNALKKVQNLNLNLDKFVFIVPQAISMQLLSNNFWNTLCCKLNELGYDVLCNSSTKIKTYGELKYSSDMTIEECLYIASLSKNIIALRCGFIEPLVFSEVPMNVVYTEPTIPIISRDTFRKYFTLKSYCKNTKIYEYSLNNSEHELLNKILANLKEYYGESV